MAIANDKIAKCLLKSDRTLSLFLLILEDQSQTTPSGQVYLHIHLYLKNMITSTKNPNKFRKTRPFVASAEFSNMNGLIHSNPPDINGKGVGMARIIARMKKKYLIFPALNFIPGTHSVFSMYPEVS
jgi:hypothetical protein